MDFNNIRPTFLHFCSKRATIAREIDLARWMSERTNAEQCSGGTRDSSFLIRCYLNGCFGSGSLTSVSQKMSFETLGWWLHGMHIARVVLNAMSLCYLLSFSLFLSRWPSRAELLFISWWKSKFERNIPLWRSVRRKLFWYEFSVSSFSLQNVCYRVLDTDLNAGNFYCGSSFQIPMLRIGT